MLWGVCITGSLAERQTGFDPASVPAFQDGDVVNFIGDSITHGGRWHTYITDFYRTRFPERHIQYANTGVSGDVVGQVLARFDPDVAPVHANVAVVMLGMNDVGSGLYPASEVTPEILAKRQALVERYIDGMQQLVDRLRQSGAKTVILVGPSPYDQTAKIDAPNNPGRDDVLKTCSERLAVLAAKDHTYLVDFHGPMAAMDLLRQQQNPQYTLIGPDRIHPTSPGSLVMASLFLAAQHVPALVSAISLNGVQRSCEECTLTHVMQSKDKVTFDVMEARLPDPIDPAALSALPLPGGAVLPGQEILRIGGLEEGKYSMLIDGSVMGTLTAEQLSAGVNLAEWSTTPQALQARRVEQLDEQIRQQRVTLRELAVVRYTVLLPTKIDMTDETATNAFLVQYLVDQKKNVPGHNAYIAGLIERYPKSLASEPELLASIAKETQMAEEAGHPVLHHYEVRKAN
jgi:lysophospholipase L1-like esterase